nr:hypothetical protein [Tanacetum cinerariifolium]
MTGVVVLSGEDGMVSWMMMVWFDGMVEMAWCGGGSCLPEIAKKTRQRKRGGVRKVYRVGK